ncbi:MAG: DNA-3-methyladenine glycosylase I [Candidatus Tokpelaia sp.]|nr:MAG: DNA-3-methyladenine glycosylase I [Candidatus Tokpelaia sp.]KAA6207316.1 MAG: DNA-3-methyladenine glycosylase I [Candidatus Tokpelaia sp.]
MNSTGNTIHKAEPEPPAPEGLLRGHDGRLRCFWAGHDPLYQAYHDTEWGRPIVNDRKIFEMLCLEGLQAGLSWITILRKRDNFRAALKGFDFYQLAAANADKAVNSLMLDSGLIRHRGKLAAVFSNAGAAVKLVAEHGSLAAWLRQFLPPATERYRPANAAAFPAAERGRCAARLARDLKKRGFRFIGPVTAYAFMQAAGLVNDHSAGCCCHAATAAAQRAFYADNTG